MYVPSKYMGIIFVIFELETRNSMNEFTCHTVTSVLCSLGTNISMFANCLDFVMFDMFEVRFSAKM